MAAIEITDKNFESEVLKSDLPVLVDFWAQWCGPCKMISPIIEELSNEFVGRMKVAKVNVDDVQDVAIQFNVMSIPTLILFKAGKPVTQVVGAMSKDQLLAKINPNLK